MPLKVTSPVHEVSAGTPRYERSAQMTWDSFVRNGHTNHSRAATLLPVIMNRCEKEGIPYILKAFPGAGYYIERDKETEKWLKDRSTGLHSEFLNNDDGKPL